MHSALKVYESVRLPFTSAVVDRAHVTGLMYEFNGPEHYDGSLKGMPEERSALERLGKQLTHQWSWQWELPFEADWEKALEKYEQECLVAGAASSKSRCLIQ